MDPWTEPFRARHETEPCQKDVVVPRCMGSEDCLHMNIYTKNLNPKVLYPVMVYLFGGAFMFGSKSKDVYNPEYLLRKDVVVIVINYRIGIFGKFYLKICFIRECRTGTISFPSPQLFCYDTPRLNSGLQRMSVLQVFQIFHSSEFNSCRISTL